MTIYDLIRQLCQQIRVVFLMESVSFRVQKEYVGQRLLNYRVIAYLADSNFLERRRLVQGFSKLKWYLENHNFRGGRNPDVTLEYGQHRVEHQTAGDRPSTIKVFEIGLSIQATEDLPVPGDFTDMEHVLNSYNISR